MHVRELRAFLERPNNALFVTGEAEQWRWLEHPKSVMWVNHGGAAQRVLGVAQAKQSDDEAAKADGKKNEMPGEIVPWPKVVEQIATDLRAIPHGFVTLASFDPRADSPEPLRCGSCYAIDGIEGTENPYIALLIAAAVLAVVGVQAMRIWKDSRNNSPVE